MTGADLADFHHRLEQKEDALEEALKLIRRIKLLSEDNEPHAIINKQFAAFDIKLCEKALEL